MDFFTNQATDPDFAHFAFEELPPELQLLIFEELPYRALKLLQ